jgi:hypothetical protein
MLEELEYNLWEAILVRLVDYGHTVSPDIEMAALRYARCASTTAYAAPAQMNDTNCLKYKTVLIEINGFAHMILETRTDDGICKFLKYQKN